MTVALFLSPHLDDAVISCAGRIRRHVARGERVVLLTVFSHADSDDAWGWAARRREDERAASLLGAEPRWLGMVDAPFRDTAYAGFDFDVLSGPHAPGDDVWRERVVERLREELEALRPTTVYAPLGVGDHVDHRLVFEAAAALHPAPRFFYEDHPYALVRHAVRRRLDALGLAIADDPTPPPSPTEYLEALADAPYIHCYLPPGPARERCFVRLRHLAHPTRPPPRPRRARAPRSLRRHPRRGRDLELRKPSPRPLWHARALPSPRPRARRAFRHHRPPSGALPPRRHAALSRLDLTLRTRPPGCR